MLTVLMQKLADAVAALDTKKAALAAAQAKAADTHAVAKKTYDDAVSAASDAYQRALAGVDDGVTAAAHEHAVALDEAQQTKRELDVALSSAIPAEQASNARVF